MSDIILTDPNIIFLLMTFGLYGLIYEFVSPGAFLPGITGAILLLMAIFFISRIPVDYFGLLLMILGIGGMTAEAFVNAKWVLGVAGAVAFAAGGILFADSGVNPWLVGSMSLVSFGTLSVGLKAILKTRKRSVSTGAEALLHSTAEIIQWSQSKGEVMVAGTVWKARSSQDYILKKGDKVKVAGVEGLCLIIQPVH
jgi:membrane-bound serine protease (ClpP class)